MVYWQQCIGDSLLVVSEDFAVDAGDLVPVVASLVLILAILIVVE
jgi:hypothetical protein